MRVLVACEESGVVRDAFRDRGHEAWSNDLVCARNGGLHLQMDCLYAIQDHGPWDLIIFHPECTKMAVSGNRWYGQGKPRHSERIEAISWTRGMWELIKVKARIGACMENPQSVLWAALGIRPQWIQPNMFGHPEQKKTGLALDRLPQLKATRDVLLEMQLLPRKERERIFFMSPGPNRSRDRSETFPGIAQAMAEQWGGDADEAIDGYAASSASGVNPNSPDQRR